MNKQTAQFWTAVLTTAGMIAITAVLILAMIVNQARDSAVGETLKSATLLVIGGLVAQSAHAAAWLFSRNGDTH